MKSSDYGNAPSMKRLVSDSGFMVFQIAITGVYFGLYYFISFEVAVLAALGVITMQVAQP